MAYCPNCGNKPYSVKDPCRQCGWVEPETNRKLEEATLIYCPKCCAHFLNGCGQKHESEET